VDAVKWWNSVGRFFGAKMREVRDFMLDPNKYKLEPSSIDRSRGARLRENATSPPPHRRLRPRTSHQPRNRLRGGQKWRTASDRFSGESNT
jgi:hypothetical protein